MLEFIALPFPFPSKIKIWSFHVVVVQWRQRNVQKKMMIFFLRKDLFCPLFYFVADCFSIPYSHMTSRIDKIYVYVCMYVCMYVCTCRIVVLLILKTYCFLTFPLLSSSWFRKVPSNSKKPESEQPYWNVEHSTMKINTKHQLTLKILGSIQ